MPFDTSGSVAVATAASDNSVVGQKVALWTALCFAIPKLLESWGPANFFAPIPLTWELVEVGDLGVVSSEPEAWNWERAVEGWELGLFPNNWEREVAGDVEAKVEVVDAGDFGGGSAARRRRRSSEASASELLGSFSIRALEELRLSI